METKKSISTAKITFVALCVVINIIGGFLALAFRLAIYLDTIGTIFSAIVLGPIWGVVTGILSGLVNGLVFDPTSLYYIPVQMVIGFLTGYLFKNHNYKGIQTILKILVVTLSGVIMSSLITTFVFSGITSSGSSYVVALARSMGMNLFSSVFSVQILSDLFDKFISFGLVFAVLKILPKEYLYKLRKD